MCKASAILKEEIFNHQFFYSKFIDLQFSGKVVISICSFPKTTYDLQIVRPYFAPWSVLLREEIGVYVSELWSYWTWTIKALAKSLVFCWQTNAKWLGILQWLEFPPMLGWDLLRWSLDPCWPWVWLPQPGQGIVDLFLSCLGGCVGGCCFHCWYEDNQFNASNWCLTWFVEGGLVMLYRFVCLFQWG